jgi:hypothetical protein
MWGFISAGGNFLSGNVTCKSFNGLLWRARRRLAPIEKIPSLIKMRGFQYFSSNKTTLVF